MRSTCDAYSTLFPTINKRMGAIKKINNYDNRQYNKQAKYRDKTNKYASSNILLTTYNRDNGTTDRNQRRHQKTISAPRRVLAQSYE